MTLQFVFMRKSGKLARKAVFSLAVCVCFFLPVSLKGDVEGSKTNEYKNTINMIFKRIEPGSFFIGSKKDKDLVTKVNITKPFFISIFEVTQTQYVSVARKNPSNMKNNDFPVNMVSWVDAQRFCRLLSKRENLTYRLPTNAEWEYCCRAGTNSDYYWGSDSIENYAWYQKNSSQTIHKVGQKRPNVWGLFDMNGNVSELCLDGYEVYYGKELTDPRGRIELESGILRGGDWNSPADFCNSSLRLTTSIIRRSPFNGFRIILEIP